MELEEFLEKYHHNILVEYERSKQSWEDCIKPGVVVATLRAGFCGPAASLRVVAVVRDSGFGPYAELVSVSGSSGISLLYKNDREPWWQNVVIIDYDHFKSLGCNSQSIYINGLAGFHVR